MSAELPALPSGLRSTLLHQLAPLLEQTVPLLTEWEGPSINIAPGLGLRRRLEDGNRHLLRLQHIPDADLIFRRQKWMRLLIVLFELGRIVALLQRLLLRRQLRQLVGRRPLVQREHGP